MFEHILLAYDGSAHARKAAELAGQLARDQQPRATLCVLVVMESSPAETVAGAAAGPSLIREARDILGSGLELAEELALGHPAEEIIKTAERRHCDLIVMGTRGRSPLQGLLFGSNSLRVITQAPCPVMVVR